VSNKAGSRERESWDSVSRSPNFPYGGKQAEKECSKDGFDYGSKIHVDNNGYTTEGRIRKICYFMTDLQALKREKRMM
jgi:hypothetical protein